MLFRILGPLTVEHEGQPIDLGRRKQRSLLAVVLIHANTVVSSDLLVEELWPHAPPADGAGALQVQVSRLRRALSAGTRPGHERLESRRPGYLLHVAGDEIDAEVFWRLAATGRAALDAGDPTTCLAHTDRALALWRGRALGEFADEPFALAEVARLDEGRLAAQEARLDARLALGHHGAVAGEARRLVDEHPGREHLWGQLMLALYRSGRQAEALRAYGEVRSWLGEELGIEPSAELRELEGRVLLQKPELDWSPRLAGRMTPVDGRHDRRSRQRPAAALAAPDGALVGRSEPLEQLLAVFDRAVKDGPELVLIGGEPGVGKTRLAMELARVARSQGAQLLLGRCDEDLAVPYQPFAEALSPWLRTLSADELHDRLGPRAADLTRLLPELADRVPDRATSAEDPQTARLRLFEAVAMALALMAEEAPVVLLLDDLQWAAPPTLLLLRHLVQRSRPMAVLAVGTFRDTEPGGADPVLFVGADAETAGRCSSIALTGLEESAVSQLVEDLAGTALGGRSSRQGLVRTLHQGTGGNPLFVRHLVRHLTESGQLAGPGATLPDTVRDVVRRRLARLSETAVKVLETAAVIGQRHDLVILQGAARLEEEPLLGGVEEAQRAGLLTEVSGWRLGQRFTHAIVREVLYAGLPATRRAHLHRLVGEAMEAAGPPYSEQLPELARHFAHAAAMGGATRAVLYATRAGDRAYAQLAYDEAARHYRSALDTLPAATPDDGASLMAQRCDLLLALGGAERRCGSPGYRETMLHAARVATAAGDASRLARAALGSGREFWSFSGAVDDTRVATIEAALAALGAGELEGGTSLRARLLACLAVELVYAGDHDRVRRLSDEALALVRTGADLPALAAVLGPRYNSIRGDPATLDERLANTAELLEVAGALGDPTRLCEAVGWRSVAAMEAADVEEADALLDAFGQQADELHQPTMLWYAAYLRAARALVGGDFGAAGRLVADALALGRAAGQPDAELFAMTQTMLLDLERGEMGRWVRRLRLAVENQPASAWFLRSWQAVTYCELDRPAEARELLDRLSANGFSDLGYEPTRLHILTNCAAACAFVGDAEVAVRLTELLEPHRHQLVTMCSLGYTGSVSHYLALLATTAHRFDDADAAFTAAEAVHRRIGAPGWLARTQLEWARSLLLRGEGEYAAQAGDLLRQARVGAETLGARGTARRAAALLPVGKDASSALRERVP